MITHTGSIGPTETDYSGQKEAVNELETALTQTYAR
jgi:hypothetical protein